MEKLQTQEVQPDIEIEKIAEVFYRYDAPPKIIDAFVAGVIWQQSLNSDKYLLTKEQIIKIIGVSWEAGADYDQIIGGIDKQQIIKNLFK